jgi:hypothetical protein
LFFWKTFSKGGLLPLIINPGWTWETYSLYQPGLKPLSLLVRWNVSVNRLLAIKMD